MQINQPTDGQCGYVGFYNGRRVEVYADTLMGARDKISAFLRIPLKKQHGINVMLVSKDGKEVVHTADF